MSIKDRPWLTIVIPTLNRSHLLGRAVTSALAQVEPGLEILVSDNGSTDNTTAILAGFDDPRLRCFRHHRKMSATDHGNFLLEKASGEFFLGLSDDDFLEPGFASAVRARLEHMPSLNFVYTQAFVHYGQVAVPTLAGPALESGEEMLRAFYAGQREICWCACVCRLSAMRSIGPIPASRIFGDMFYWSQLALQGEVGCIEQSLTNYTFMTQENFSTSVPITRWASETRLLADQVIAALSARGRDDAIMKALRADIVCFVARSSANQAVWNLIRGTHRIPVLKEIWRAREIFLGSIRSWPRVIVSFLLPRSILRYLVVKAAMKRATSRSVEK